MRGWISYVEECLGLLREIRDELRKQNELTVRLNSPKRTFLEELT